jgi:phosphate-selective porin OprO/OprP
LIAVSAMPLAAEPKDDPIAAGVNGITVKSDEGKFLLKIGADLQLDYRGFLEPGSFVSANSAASGAAVPTGAAMFSDAAVLRRARPTFSGTLYQHIDYFVRPDFGLGQTVLYDAYVELRYWNRLQFRAGKFKPPVGMERLQSDDDTSFVERGLPTLLAPSRDIGYMVSGELLNAHVSYAAGVFGGAPDNGLGDRVALDRPDYAARVFLRPFLGGAENRLGGLGFGMGVSAGSMDGIATPVYRTFGQNAFLNFASGVTSAGYRTRIAPQAHYYTGPFGVFSEYTFSQEGFQKGPARQTVMFRSWQVQLTYIVTGERKSFNSPVPRRPLDFRNLGFRKHGWGAVELAARAGDFSASDGIYANGLADPAKSARRAREWVGGVNWYLNRLVRISVDYAHTNFERGAVSGNRPTERAILSRFQINWM